MSEDVAASWTGAGPPKADTFFEEAKEPNPDGVDVAGFAGVENSPEEVWLLACEG